MKQIVTFFVLSFVSLTFLQSSAHAGVNDDIALSVSVSPTAGISPGTGIDVTYTDTNVGSTTLAPRSVHYIIYPPELTYASFTTSIPDFVCPYPQPMSEIDLSFGPRFANHYLIYCYQDGQGADFLSPLAPGQSTSFTVHFTATNSFVDNSTTILGLNLGAPDEKDYNDFTLALQQAAENGEDPTSFPYNNIATYVYAAPVPVTTNVPSANTSSDTTTNTTQSSNTRPGAHASSNIGQDGSALLETDDTNDVLKKAEVALDLRNSLPDRISRQDESTFEALLSGKYKNQLIGLGSVLAIGAVGFIFFRRRYLKKTDSNKEYRRALRVKQLNSAFPKFELPTKDDTLV